MVNLEIYYLNYTVVPSFSLRASDWLSLAGIMKRSSDVFDDISHQLKVISRVESPPTGTTLVETTNIEIGLYLRLYSFAAGRFRTVMAPTMLSRFNTALSDLSGTIPEITAFFTDLNANTTEEINIFQEDGRKWLRGRLG